MLDKNRNFRELLKSLISWSLNIVMERYSAGKSDPEKNKENINLLFRVLQILGIHIDEKGTILDQ